MKTIALISVNAFKPGLTDGASTAMWQLLQAIGRRGHRVLIISFLSNDPFMRRIFDRYRGTADSRQESAKDFYTVLFRDAVLHQRLLPYSYGEIPAHYQEASSLIYKTIQDYRPDFILSYGGDNFSCLPIHLSGLACAVFFHSQLNVAEAAQHALTKRLLKRATRVYAVSAYIQSEVSHLLDLKSEVWNPYIELEQYLLPTPSRGQAIGYYSAGLHKGDSIIESIVTMNPDRRFIIAGAPPQFVSGSGHPNVHYMGFVADMPSSYSEIALLLVPSLVPEAFSRVILEAACNGIPTIGNAVGGIPEALGEGGVTIDVDLTRVDPEAIAKKYSREIARLLDHPSNLHKYQERAESTAACFRQRQEKMLTQFLEEVVGP